jgi:hypothetical protein
MCLELLHNWQTANKVLEYDDYMEHRAEFLDRKLTRGKGGEADVLSSHPLIQLEHKIVKGYDEKMRSRDYPSINCFMNYDHPKASKMPLCFEAVPSKDVDDLFRSDARKYIASLGIDSLQLPDLRSCATLGSQLYADGTETKHDCEEPESSYENAFIYKSFWTDPVTKRETWIPCKGFKMMSQYWHQVASQLVDADPSLVGNDTVADVRRQLHKRMKGPVRKIDIKGFGIQIPKSYVIILMEEICRSFPHIQLSGMKDWTKSFIENFQVLMPDGKFITPVRGIGLGYLERLKTIACRICLSAEVHVPAMFGDDILVDEDDYEIAVNRLNFFQWIINWEKTGKIWYTAPYFMNISMQKRGSTYYSNANGQWSAVVLSKYHYIRKNLFLQIRYAGKWRMRFHYRMIFNWELHPGEVYDHPSKWGLDERAEFTTGFVKGGLLRKFTYERFTDLTEYRVRCTDVPYKKWDLVRFERLRKKAKKHKSRVWCTTIDDFRHPTTSEHRFHDPHDSSKLTKGIVPTWYDIREIINHGISHRKFTKGLPESLAAKALVQWCFARDPIQAELSGGVIVTSCPSIRHSVTGLREDLYNALYKSCKVAKDIEKVCKVLPTEYTAPDYGLSMKDVEDLMKENYEGSAPEFDKDGFDQLLSSIDSYLAKDGDVDPGLDIDALSEEGEGDLFIEDDFGDFGDI